jgi:hypothetical protein
MKTTAEEAIDLARVELYGVVRMLSKMSQNLAERDSGRGKGKG